MSENSKMTISAGTIARTVCLCLALINQILAAMGHSVIDVSNDDVNTLISTGFTVVSAIIAWWKNNSFTQSALKADEVMKEEKANGRA
ncbi:MAG: phage holin [Monoglobaceae bacterium]